MSYDILKDHGDPERAQAWATLAKAIPAAIDASATMKVAWAASQYETNPDQENFDNLKSALEDWRNQCKPNVLPLISPEI
jgi:hypothetical protein